MTLPARAVETFQRYLTFPRCVTVIVCDEMSTLATRLAADAATGADIMIASAMTIPANSLILPSRPVDPRSDYVAPGIAPIHFFVMKAKAQFDSIEAATRPYQRPHGVRASTS